MASLAITPFAARRPLPVYQNLESFPFAFQPLTLKRRFSVEVCGSSFLWWSKRPRRARNHVCSSFLVGSAGKDALCTAAGFAGAYAWIRIFDLLGEKNVLEQKLSRKLIHVSTGLLYVMLWPFFSASPWSRFFALAIPMANATRLAVNGFGLLKDEGFVKSISREGTAGELLRGPFYYALVLSCCTVCFWRDSPVGMTAIAIMCGGDGIADIVGRRIGGIKLPHNTRKSWAGSISMFVFGFALSVCFLYYFSTSGYYLVDWTSAIWNVALISFVATVVESLPISGFLDDNISVPLASVILGLALFSTSM
ncbi:hypothetical protein GOP47_0012404 [Adiantum capillus-veneris]|uniref:phytol kinase n=1 Tax=Adiantum capillus-veneris TaxID=13818 RepID=A0A9D4UQL6_ADICA|nr:hypothetical protein GOP47_0012404 [Adiantum capillus-veneris]